MNPAFIALLLYGLWMMILLWVMLVVRVLAVRKGTIQMRDISPANREISPFAYRLSRVHANCYESFPIFIAIVFVAFSTGRITVIDVGAYVFLVARVLQGAAHLYATTPRAVALRGLFFGVQVLFQLYWIISILLF